jgi:hypothetical protein
MLLNVEGRVRNINLPASSSLLPLLEAIVNSYDALEHCVGQSEPRITIKIKRDRTQLALKEDETESYPISEFIVEDNGLGFNDVNFESFCTSDSTLKIENGGKGIGRLLWLKAFKSVSIESIFEQNGVFLKRNFNFTLSRQGIEGGEKPETTCETILRTSVHLIGFKEEFKKTCPKKLDTLAHKIIQHFIAIFMSQQCPTVCLIDDDEVSLNLNEVFRTEYKEQSRNGSFQVKGETFLISSIKIKSGDHHLSFCANNREVFGEELKDSIPDLASKLKMEDGSTFAYQAFVSSSLFNSTVNAERTGFHIPEKPLPLMPPEELTFSDIRQTTLTEVESELEPFLSPVQKQKIERVEKYIHSQAPQYRPLLKYGLDEIKNLPPSLNEESLDMELYKINQKHEIDIKQKSKEYLNSNIKDIQASPEYKEKFSKFFEKLNDLGKANIAKYIVHRKTVLDLFDRALKLNANDKYALEESIHGIVFPLRTTSEEISYDQHNLWILDEKLAYHHFLASDIKFNQIEILNSDSNSRCDLLVLNNPCAFTDETNEYSSIVIVEFKRSMRNDFDAYDNPIVQVYGYIRELRNQTKLDKDGRAVVFSNSTPIYVFIACDLTMKMKEFAGNSNLTLMPDKMGYFGFNSELSAYVEILSYNKILSDSQKRNRVLFDRLNIS